MLTTCRLWVVGGWIGGIGMVGSGLLSFSRQRRVAASRYPSITGYSCFVTLMSALDNRTSQPLSQRTGMDIMLCFTVANLYPIFSAAGRRRSIISHFVCEIMGDPSGCAARRPIGSWRSFLVVAVGFR
jgi:hypothetical protein